MNLLPAYIRKQLPKLYATEHVKPADKISVVRLVVPLIVWPRRGTKGWPLLGTKCHSYALLGQVLAMFEVKQCAIGSKGWPRKHKSRPKWSSVRDKEQCARFEAFLPINERRHGISLNQLLDGLRAVANRLGTVWADTRITFWWQTPQLEAKVGQRGQPLGRTTRLFTPDSSWLWHIVEFDGRDTFFGFVIGFEAEWGYISLAELQTVRGPLGLPIERDAFWRPKPMREAEPTYFAAEGRHG
jgi:hypothetical protein